MWVAKKPSFTQQKLGALGVSKPAKPVKPKRGAKPSGPIGRPAPLVALHERYGLVYDPNGEADPIVRDELDALNELYKDRTGRDIADEDDARVALERAGLLKPTVSRKRASELRRGGSEEFASALDALDAFKPRVSEGLIGRGVEALGDVREAVAETRLPVVGLPGGARAAAQVEAPTIGEVAAEAAKGVAGVAGEVAKAPVRAVNALARTQIPVVGLPGQARAAAQERAPSAGEIAGRGAGGVARGAGAAIGRAVELEPVGLVGTVTEAISPSEPTVAGAVGELKRIQSDFAAGKGTNQIDPAEQLRIAREALSGITDPNAFQRELAFIDTMASGAPASDGEFVRKTLGLGPLDPGRRGVYLKYARAKGWDIANPRKYTDAELAKMAFTKKGAVAEATRSYFRQIGEFASAPLAIPAIVEAATSGDPAQQKMLIDSIVEPYAYLKDDIERRGLGPALSSFAQERPLDFILIANSLWRGLGRVGGAGARTVGGTGTSIFQTLVPEAQSGLRRRVGEFARTDRPVTIPMPRVERAAGEVNLEPVAVAVTGKNLFDTVAAEAYALGLRGGMRLGVPGASRLAGRRAARAFRRANNMADDAAAQATLDLREASQGLNRSQLLRLALELTVARIRPDGEPYSFAQRAEFFRGLANDSLTESRRQPENARRHRADAKRFFDQAEFYQQVANTPLDAAVIERAREVAREVGQDNDTIISMLMGQFDEVENPSGLERTKVRYAELQVGDRIDIGRGGAVEPAVVTGVERLPNGGLRVRRRSVIDPRNELSIDVLGAQRVDRLRPGVNAKKYTRQLIEWEGLIDEAAKAEANVVNAAIREAARAETAPLRRLNVLEGQRTSLRNQLLALRLELDEARAAGSLAGARQKQRSIEFRTRRLLRILREMQRIADAEDVPATIRMADGSERVGRLADELERQRREIVTQRGVGGRAPFTGEGRRVEEVPDLATERAARQVRAIEAGETAPALVRQIEQPEAARRVEQAARLDARAAELRRLEEDLVAQRAAAPSAAAARRAERDIEVAREDARALGEQAAAASQVPRNLESVFDELKARLEYLADRRVLSASGVSQRAFNEKTRQTRIRVARELADIRRKVLANGRFFDEDIDALERVESAILNAERTLERYKAFAKRPGGVQRVPDGFGVASVRERVGGPETAPRRVLGEQAEERLGRVETLQERINRRRAAPPLRGETVDVEGRPSFERASIGSVRRERKRLENEASRMRREAIKIIKRGRPVSSSGFLDAVIDATGDAVAFKVDIQKPVYVTVKQLRNQTKEEFIATAELYGLDPVLYLGTRVARWGRAQGVARREELDFSDTAGIPSERLKQLTGQQYRRGLEDTRQAWRNLLSDMGQIRSAVEMQQQVRALVELVGVRVDNLTEKEAAILNGDRRVKLSEGEAVVFDSRDYIPIIAGRAQRKKIFTGVSDTDGNDASLLDLFMREVKRPDVLEAGDDYILIPKYMYDAMTRELARITYTPGRFIDSADKITREWRNFTLNIFPRTGFANLIGSTALAAIGGAGPRSFYLAYRYIKYGDVPAPRELRQRFALTLTSEAEFARARAALPQERVPIPGTSRTVGAEDPLRALAWWMNTMRRFNGVSEDFGRLAVWYSRAFPEATKLADDSFRARWLTMRSITSEAEDLLEKFANGDPEYAAKAARFTDAAYEFVGDLHSGGQFNTVLRIAIPFQQWYRHILRLTLITMPLKYPGRTLFLTRLSEIGQEYQREHGVLPAWFADVWPILVEEKLVGGLPQEYVLAWRTSPWNPLATPAELFSGGELRLEDYVSGTLTPIWRNSLLFGYSMLTGKAKQVGNGQITSDVRNQFGLAIDMYSTEGVAYGLNLAFGSMPGNSMAMSMAAQTAESNFLFGETIKLQRGPEGFLPPEAVAPDVPGRDLRQLITDFSYENLLTLWARMMVGGSAQWVYGPGRVQDLQFKSIIERAKSNSKYEQNQEARVRAMLEELKRQQEGK